MAEFYRCIYPGFQQARFETMMKQFHLDGKRKISTFSKGMKKQLLVILGISTGTKYLFCDEPLMALTGNAPGSKKYFCIGDHES